MKKIFVLAVLIVIAGPSLFAQETKTVSNKKFMQISTVESVVSGGLGRSKMIITNPDGSQKESDLENLFSLVGINFKNLYFTGLLTVCYENIYCYHIVSPIRFYRCRPNSAQIAGYHYHRSSNLCHGSRHFKI